MRGGAYVGIVMPSARGPFLGDRQPGNPSRCVLTEFIPMSPLAKPSKRIALAVALLCLSVLILTLFQDRSSAQEPLGSGSASIEGRSGESELSPATELLGIGATEGRDGQRQSLALDQRGPSIQGLRLSVLSSDGLVPLANAEAHVCLLYTSPSPRD